ncbi:MAG: MBL fold metallo-hydrolase [Proteobacteria bacterium]|nr:MBL fold metallo-hydrolase [Pseudomonadota bacterium]
MKHYEVKSLYDEITATVTYIVFDTQTLDAVVIDPVLDYEPASSKISTESLDLLESQIKVSKLNLLYCFETHAHADHLSGAQELKKRFPQIKLAIGEHITLVQGVFKKIYNLPENFIPNGNQFDRLLKDGEILNVGNIEIKVLSTPGHTPACVSYLIGDAVFTGDALFMPDSGTGRCDFPMGSSEALYLSITKKLFQLPDKTRVFVGHDYKANGTRIAQWESSIALEKSHNIQLKSDTLKDDYVKMRDARDATLDAPRLLLPSIQVNIDGGRLPAPESNGRSYLKIPINKK